MLTHFPTLTDSAKWFAKRDQAMQAARSNMAALMNPNSFWACDRNHPTVLEANRTWVERARRCHNLAMGREPLFHHTFITNEGVMQSGLVYARRA